jgi:hemerythrin-like metal-binding protein
MSLLEWKSEFSVGIESMDFEHRKMIGMINEIYDELTQHRDAESIEQFLGDIHAAISAHFALEERMMRNAGFGDYEAHKDDHEELLDQIRDMMEEFRVDSETGFGMLKENLADWFEAHFASFDAHLHGQLGGEDHSQGSE